MTAVNKPLYIEQGATFQLGFTWHQQGPLDANGNPTPGTPYDLTGCTVRMQIRRKQGDPALVTATSDDSGSGITGAGRIFIGGPPAVGWVADPTNGRIDVVLTDADTDAITSKTCVYDLEVEWPLQAWELSPRVDRLLEGTVTVDPNITQVATDPVVT